MGNPVWARPLCLIMRSTTRLTSSSSGSRVWRQSTSSASRRFTAFSYRSWNTSSLFLHLNEMRCRQPLVSLRTPPDLFMVGLATLTLFADAAHEAVQRVVAYRFPLEMMDFLKGWLFIATSIQDPGQTSQTRAVCPGRNETLSSRTFSSLLRLVLLDPVLE